MTVAPQDIKMLDFAKLDWSPHSFEDPGGRVFSQHGRLYRALRGLSARAFETMETEKLLVPAQAIGLVRTWRSDIAVDGYELVVEHERLPASPVVSEWSPHMLADAAVMFCRLSTFLAEHGLQFQDSHGWNFMFRGSSPIYVDFSSIIPLADDARWKPLDEFINCFLHPLQLISRRQADYAFFLLGTQNWVPIEKTIPYFFARQHAIMLRLAMRRIRSLTAIQLQNGPKSATVLATMLEDLVKTCDIPRAETRWSEYATAFPSTSKSATESWTQKQRSVYATLQQLSRGRVLDIGCNTGWYSLLAAQLGHSVVSMDTDRACIDGLYREASRMRLDITPVVASPFQPLIPHGTRFYESLESRFQADHVLMLAIAHHLFFKQGYDIATIINTAQRMARETLVIEYTPVSDYWIQNWGIVHRVEEYAQEAWMRELAKHFASIEILPSEFSHPSSNVQRQLLVARR